MIELSRKKYSESNLNRGYSLYLADMHHLKTRTVSKSRTRLFTSKRRREVMTVHSVFFNCYKHVVGMVGNCSTFSCLLLISLVQSHFSKYQKSSLSAAFVFVVEFWKSGEVIQKMG